MTQPQQVNLPPEVSELFRAEALRDTPKGYEMFYSLIWNRGLPEHGRDWVERIWKARDAGKPVLLEAFRGSTKTTIVTNTLAAYLHGLYPAKTGLIIQSGDDSAIKNSAAVAEIIEFNIAFKFFFPWVVPDKERGWSSTGYNIKDTRVEYTQWVRSLSKDPSLVGYGYKSAAIIGMHPSLYIFPDDLHNEENTRSDLEIQHVKTIWNGTISPTRKPHNPLVVFPFTPWRSNDLYADLKATNAFTHIRTPVRTGEVYTWPEVIDAEVMAQIEKEDTTGGVETARMYYLDLEVMTKRVFQYQQYPARLLNITWPTMSGCDPASESDPSKRDDTHSHFARADVAITPENDAVILGGELEQVGLSEAADFIYSASQYFPNWLGCSIEKFGQGDIFFQFCRLRPGLNVFQTPIGTKSKAERLVKFMGPWLKNGKLRVSDADTPFLRALRAFLNRYPNVGKHDPGWDAADAVYQVVAALPNIFQNIPSSEVLLAGGRKAKPKSPWSSLGHQNYAQ